ncbi:zinc finger and BTB domain-containing protein 21 isoform X2 [Gouania willdenowi]|uniref:zinc finger and BTB domain-containing protein 21 isoform X2 n=1 Tax=Gouania willdenowi TaxID=441366 RepID=UPI0010560306|nr:zinc finger and BTB domain-containing protein 21 isoform X2 [Gouania willdenowi]
MTSNSRWMGSRPARTNQHNTEQSPAARRRARARPAMESLVHYSNPSHALSMLGVLNEQRLRGQMCDVVLVVADQKYQAHKSVLAASSEYFQSLFTQMNTESLRVVNLDFCEPDAFEIVLNYIYSSSLFVDKGSLAAIQELGYSLGIPFLTNIVSARPHASYCVSRKRLSVSEEDDNDVHTRSVIVCRVQNDTEHHSRSNYPRKTSVRPSSPLLKEDLAPPPLEYNSNNSLRNSEPRWKSPEQSKPPERSSTYPYISILKGNSSLVSCVRPQLTSSVSFSDVDVQHSQLHSDADHDMKEEAEEQEPSTDTKALLLGRASKPSQTIDRSGPLIKSLLRRSLSMDSPIPVFSPTLELNREQSVVKMASKSSETEVSTHSNPTRTSPLVLRSKCPSRCEKESQVERDFVKAEPSSPLADPMDMIRMTVAEALPVDLKDLQDNYDHEFRSDVAPLSKRKNRPDNRRYPFKKSKIFKEHTSTAHVPDTLPLPESKEFTESSEEPLQNKVFKCWNCLKVFRSSTGLHRHVNMYHNPEKPYACDICHKRFHTNFKVWTHCQTQHGVVQNPASSASSPVLDDKFQKRLIDIVREREIKKALLWKLKRNKQSLQSPGLSKKRLRPSFICPYCGKVFVFQSQYRQHLRSHPADKAEQNMEHEWTEWEQDGMIEQKSADSEVYTCRLCNMKLPSLIEHSDHERDCQHSTVCPYCGLRFSSSLVKRDHEAHCKYKKLTCLECMRTFKTSFSIWRHQVEVHNHNIMSVKDQMQLRHQENSDEGSKIFKEDCFCDEPLATSSSRENLNYSDSSGAPMYDSEDSLSYVPEDLSMAHHGKLVVKEEPLEEAVCDAEDVKSGLEEPGVWPCEKCGNLFSSRKDLERHQELLCHIKPFICHICNKAYRTNFRLWSHFQSHMPTANEPGAKEISRQPSPRSPSPPLTPQTSEQPTQQASVLKSTQAGPVAVAVVEESSSPEPCSSNASKTNLPELEEQACSHSPVSRSNSVDNNASGPQEPDALFYHAPSLSVLTFKRQYMCKLCHRTFKTAFSLWSHEQSHSHS